MDNSNNKEDIFNKVEPNLKIGETLVWAGQSQLRLLRALPSSFIMSMLTLAILLINTHIIIASTAKHAADSDNTLHIYIFLSIFIFNIFVALMLFLASIHSSFSEAQGDMLCDGQACSPLCSKKREEGRGPKLPAYKFPSADGEGLFRWIREHCLQAEDLCPCRSDPTSTINCVGLASAISIVGLD